jgi:hypothetical protein
LLYATDSNGNTPLVSAARGGHVDVLRMLMRDADKSKLDVARAVATAQQWQRTAALDVLGARTQGVRLRHATNGAPRRRRCCKRVRRHATICGARRWPTHPMC